MNAGDAPADEEVWVQGQGPRRGQRQSGAIHWTSCEPWGQSAAAESPGQSTAGSVPGQGHRSEGQARQLKGPDRQMLKGELALCCREESVSGQAALSRIGRGGCDKFSGSAVMEGWDEEQQHAADMA